MTRYRGNPHRRRGFLGEAVHMGRKMLYSADHFFRAAGPGIRQIAMTAAPMIAKSNPAAGAAVATIGQAMGSYSELRQSLGD